MIRKYVSALLFATPVMAQVTAKITDTDGQAWIGGSYVVQLLSPNGAPTIGGIPQSVAPIRGALDSTGSLSAPLIASSSFDQSGVVYAFSISPNATYGAPIAFTVPISSTTQNLTPLLPTNIYAPRFYPGQGAYGYSDAEASKGPYPAGSSYFNVSLQATRVWNGTAWTTAGGTGGGGTGTVTSVAGISPVNGNVPLTPASIGAAATSSIPTNNNQLANGAGYVTSTGAASAAPVQSVAGRTGAIAIAAGDVSGLAPVATTGNYTSLSNTPTIPTNNNQLTNGAGYVTSSGAASAAPVQTVAGRTGAITLAAADVSGLAPSATTDATNAINIGTGVLNSLRLPLQYATLHFTAGNLTQTVTHNLGILYPNVATFYYLSGGTGCYFSANTTTTFSITCPSATDLVVSYMGGTPNHVGSYIAPTITWPTPAAIPNGSQLSSTQLNATTTAAGTFTYSPASGTTLTATTTLNTTFTPSDTSTYTTSTASVTQVVNPASRTASLVYYWPLNEGSGTTGNETVSGNNFTLSGVTWQTDPTIGAMPTFSGTSSGGAATNANANFSNTQAFSVALWAKTSTNPGFAVLATDATNANGDQGWTLYTGGGNFGVQLINSTTNTNYLVCTSTPTLSTGVVHHLAATVDGTATASGVNLYLDGSLVAKSCSGTLSATIANTTNFIGVGRTADSVNLYTGAEARKRIYSAVISASDVSTIYNNKN